MVIHIDDRDRLATTPARALALDCVAAGIEAVRPDRVVPASVSLDDGTLTVRGADHDLDGYDGVVLVGAGKATGTTARALESVLGDRLDGGVVVCPEPVETDRVDVVVGEHPVPGVGSLAAAERLVEAVSDLDDSFLLLVVLTGGASALVADPVEGIDLDDLRAVTRGLLESGAAIDEVNAVRKHCSVLKGGGLARLAAPASIVGVLISDVVGDDPAVIGSGPVSPDPTTYADAIDVLERFDLEAPTSVGRHLERGRAGEVPETPKPGDAAFARVETHVIAGGLDALEAAGSVAEGRGYEPCVLTSRLRGESTAAAAAVVAVAEEAVASANPVAAPAVLLSGGETTVTVDGDGVGGPNLEFALAALRERPPGVTVASVDTDGRDGGTDAAGALVDASMPADRRAIDHALDDNDAYPLLESLGALVVTGRTGTNVNDLRVVVVEDPDG